MHRNFWIETVALITDNQKSIHGCVRLAGSIPKIGISRRSPRACDGRPTIALNKNSIAMKISWIAGSRVWSRNWADYKITLESMVALKLAKRSRFRGMREEPQNRHLGRKLGPNPAVPFIAIERREPQCHTRLSRQKKIRP